MAKKSIFDYAPTREELAQLGLATDQQVDEYRQIDATEEGSDWWRLCFLFAERGDQAEVDRLLVEAEKEGFTDLYTLEHELAGGCLHP